MEKTVKRFPISEGDLKRSSGHLPPELTFVYEDDWYYVSSCVYYLPGHRPDFIPKYNQELDSQSYPGLKYCAYFKD